MAFCKKMLRAHYLYAPCVKTVAYFLVLVGVYRATTNAYHHITGISDVTRICLPIIAVIFGMILLIANYFGKRD